MPLENPDELLERTEALQALRTQVRTLPIVGGGCALIVGDAGIGKSRLLRALHTAIGDDVAWWIGSCEPLLAPPPLAPLLDMLPHLPPRLAHAVRSGRVGAELFADLLSLLQSTTQPQVIVVEDAQWADGATLDLLRFLSRRIHSTRALLVLSWREHELNPGHPLRTVLAGLDPRWTQRHELLPLSPAAVARLACGSGRDATDLHTASAGNPFFVQQLLAAPEDVRLPAPLRDALLTRVAHLPEDVRAVLEAVSLSPAALELDVLGAAIGVEPEAVQAALRTGLLRREPQEHGDALRLVPDLARVVIAESLTTRTAALHAALFDASSQHGVALYRLVHHAELGGLAHVVVRLAPQAAQQASAARSHRQAAALYALALGHAAMLDPGTEAALAEAHAEECLLVNQLDEAMASRQRALTLARDAGDRVAQGRQLRVMARIEWLRGHTDDAIPLVEAALGLLHAAQPDGHEWALACLTMGQLQLLAADPLKACDWVDRALPRLRAIGDPDAEADALNTAGAARLGTPLESEGVALLEGALRMAIDAHQEEHAARAWTNLAAAALVQHRLADVERLTNDGIAYCRSRDLGLYALHLEIRRTQGWVAAGRWAAAASSFDAIAARQDLNAIQRDQLAWLRAFLALRQDVPGAVATWRRLAESGPQLQPQPWYFDPLLMRLEAAWLAGDRTLACRLAETASADPARRRDAWRWADLAVWRRRLGLAIAHPRRDHATYTRVLGGGPSDTAATWHALGLPYDQALALADGDVPMRRQALAQLQAVGALAAARRLRAALRADGLAHLPRGPYTHARHDVLGLTARQREVLDGLRRGLSNREIAATFHRSERTVEHHVAALIAKLGASDRNDAVRRVSEK